MPVMKVLFGWILRGRIYCEADEDVSTRGDTPASFRGSPKARTRNPRLGDTCRACSWVPARRLRVVRDDGASASPGSARGTPPRAAGFERPLLRAWRRVARAPRPRRRRSGVDLLIFVNVPDVEIVVA